MQRTTDNRGCVHRKTCVSFYGGGVRGFTWLEAGLLHGSLSGRYCNAGVLQVGLGYAALALAAGRPVGAQLALRGGLGAAGAAVGLLQRGHQDVCREHNHRCHLHWGCWGHVPTTL